MAQPHLTLTTIPGREDTTMVDVMVKRTRTMWVSWSITVVIQPDGIVPKGKWVDDSPSTTSTATTAILPNKTLGKLKSKGLEILEGARLSRGLQENVGICDCHIKKKEKYIFVEFSALRSAAIIPTELISTIHPTHELVVANNACWARYFHAASILLFSVDSASARRLTIRGHHHHHLPIHPCTC